MKKLFTLVIMIFGIICFANEDKKIDGTVKVGLRAQVLDPTKLLMEITALENAGKDHKSLTFDFGNLVKGISQDTLQGTFQVRLLKSSTEIAFDNTPRYTLVKYSNPADQSPEKAKNFTTNVNGVSLNYSLRETEGVAGIKRNKGTLLVSADARGSNVKLGEFTDNSIKIKITLDNQVTGLGD